MKTHPHYFSAHSLETDSAMVTLGHKHSINLAIRMSSQATNQNSQPDLGLDLLPWPRLVLLQAGSPTAALETVAGAAPLLFLPSPTHGAKGAG